ncbi:glutaredoxin domain-containing protein [Tsuneonella rigui]|uniref:glutaredoxin domain-containing protein n=1 Tax=Tsuneonella rigui TaxID=1708790 RepID=UPI001F498C3E|nr:glutaredoxin domain-containing protein [Tsuneonella rigui]
MADQRSATLYRMVLPDHICPFGVRAKALLEQNGYDVNDRVLASREEVDAFKEEQGIDTTPLVFIGDEKIGGSEELSAYLANA